MSHLLANLGWVDFDFDLGCSTLSLVLPGLMGIWQKWLSSWARSKSTQPRFARRWATQYPTVDLSLPNGVGHSPQEPDEEEDPDLFRIPRLPEEEDGNGGEVDGGGEGEDGRAAAD